MADSAIINFDDVREKANFHRFVDALSGKKRIVVKDYRPTRSSQANRFLWGAVYDAFTKFRQSQGEEFTNEMSHEFFKLKFLRKTVVNHDTGEVLGTTVGSTAKLDTAEFSEYVDKIVAWLADYGIPVPSADRYAMVA